MRRIFWGKLEIQMLFRPKNRWSQKKNEIETDFSAGSGYSNAFFRPYHDIYFTTSAPNFLWGGAVIIFSTKIGLKSTKNVQFCILHRPILRYCVLAFTRIWHSLIWCRCTHTEKLDAQFAACYHWLFPPNTNGISFRVSWNSSGLQSCICMEDHTNRLVQKTSTNKAHLVYNLT